MDVAVEDYRHYFGHSDRLQMVLNFWLNKYLYLSLAQQRAAPVVKSPAGDGDPAGRVLLRQLAA
ncbi:hypothetical protein LNP02_18610 [Klebsiella variicola subsp. variicola]|nr:hypothetical protein [Klebsiella variicola subsp. variicola]